jgi:DnaK suppressor protein
MTDSKVGQLRVMLKAKQFALEQFLRRREGIAVERIADPSDEAQYNLDRELTIRALDRESGLLSSVKFALKRMDDGTYGVCQSCDGEISEKRLAAMPWALHCIECQESIDRANGWEEELLAAS